MGDKKLVIKKEFFLNFLSTQKEVYFADIENCKTVSDQTSNERGWMINKEKKTVLYLEMRNGETFRIPGALHPKGIEYIKRKIEDKMGNNRL